MDSDPLFGVMSKVTMSESQTLQQISTYMVENKTKVALKAEVEYMVVEAKEKEMHLNGPRIDFEPKPYDKNHGEVIS